MIKFNRIATLPHKQSFFLFGARGVGKSMLLKQHFADQKSHLWIDLLSPSLEMSLANKPEKLLEMWSLKKPKWIVIDEVQKIPSILDIVHKGIEEHQILFALTGSSARKLKRGGANLLAGRAIERKLAPLSILELEDEFSLKKALSVGMLPLIWSQRYSEIEAGDFLYSYVNSYLKEEIAAEQLVRNLDPFRRFLVSAAQSNGQIINHAAIERDAGVPAKQSSRHFEILVDTLLGYYLEPYHRSLRKRQTQKAKFYFFDVGIVRALQNLAGLEVTPSAGEFGYLFEAFVINEFFKLSEAYQKRWHFSYFQTQNNNEIDLIIERPRGLPLLIEIKSTSKLTDDKLAPLINIMPDFKHEQAFLLSNDTEEKVLSKVRCLHFLNGLKEIFNNYS